MSNRTIAFLILILFCSGIFYFIYYFFIAYKSNLVIDTGGLDGVKIKLSGEIRTYPGICNKKCIFEGIPPVEYTLTATKSGYIDYSQIIKLERKVSKNISFNLKKEVQIEDDVLSKNEKLLKIKYTRFLSNLKEENTYNELNGEKVFSREVLGFYNSQIISYNSEKDFNIFLFNYDGEEKNILSIPESKIKKIFYNDIDSLIYWETTDGKKNIFDLKNLTNNSIIFDEDVNLVKRTNDLSKYIINSMNGVYIYSTLNNDYIKNTLFDDFIILDDGRILGLIKSGSKDKISLLNFEDNGKNKLVLIGQNTKERKIIYEFDDSIEYLGFLNNKIYIISKDLSKKEIKELDL